MSTKNKTIVAVAIVVAFAVVVFSVYWFVFRKKTMIRKTGRKGKNLIKLHEGLRLQAYVCPSGVLTIGYGHTSNVRSGQSISETEAEALLNADLAVAEGAVNDAGLALNQNQFDALVSFVFNVGAGNFRGSTLLKKVKANPDDESIRAEFGRWINGSSGKLAGLVKRRADEADLYFS